MNIEGLNIEGLNIEGLNIEGLNIEGLNIEGLNIEGLNNQRCGSCFFSSIVLQMCISGALKTFLGFMIPKLPGHHKVLFFLWEGPNLYDSYYTVLLYCMRLWRFFCCVSLFRDSSQVPLIPILNDQVKL